MTQCGSVGTEERIMSLLCDNHSSANGGTDCPTGGTEREQ